MDGADTNYYPATEEEAEPSGSGSEMGSEADADDSNKDEYLRLMTDWRFSRGIVWLNCDVILILDNNCK